MKEVHKQAEERVYATPQSPKQEVVNGTDHNYYTIEDQALGYHDYTVIYEDPTSPSYVVGTHRL